MKYFIKNNIIFYLKVTAMMCLMWNSEKTKWKNTTSKLEKNKPDDKLTSKAKTKKINNENRSLRWNAGNRCKIVSGYVKKFETCKWIMNK